LPRVLPYPELTRLLFSLFVHPRHPHSFPTRRSSDLDCPAGRSKLPWIDPWPRRGGCTRTHFNHGTFLSCPSPWCRLELCFDTSVDRKSTRLNSSHQIISYAVFCLKKKNN